MLVVGVASGYWRSSVWPPWWEGCYGCQLEQVQLFLKAESSRFVVGGSVNCRFVSLVYCWPLSVDYFPRDDLPSKRPCIEPSCAMRHEERDIPAVQMTWDQTHMLYPSLLYQHQAETSRFHLAHLPITSGASQAPGMKHSQINGSLNGVQLDRNNSSRLDAWGWSAERSPLASTLTEDDILEMVLWSSFSFYVLIYCITLNSWQRGSFS